MKAILIANHKKVNNKSNKSVILSAFVSYIVELGAQVKQCPRAALFFVTYKFNENTSKFELLDNKEESLESRNNKKAALATTSPTLSSLSSSASSSTLSAVPELEDVEL